MRCDDPGIWELHCAFEVNTSCEVVLSSGQEQLFLQQLMGKGGHGVMGLIGVISDVMEAKAYNKAHERMIRAAVQSVVGHQQAGVKGQQLRGASYVNAKLRSLVKASYAKMCERLVHEAASEQQTTKLRLVTRGLTKAMLQGSLTEEAALIRPNRQKYLTLSKSLPRLPPVTAAASGGGVPGAGGLVRTTSGEKGTKAAKRVAKQATNG